MYEIFGNGGELTVAPTGEVIAFNPSAETLDGDHDGYGDVIHVDLVEWRRFYGYDLDGRVTHIDILDVDCHLESGEVIKAEPEHREMCVESINLARLT